jgi:hypothetical protein
MKRMRRILCLCVLTGTAFAQQFAAVDDVILKGIADKIGRAHV